MLEFTVTGNFFYTQKNILECCCCPVRPTGWREESGDIQGRKQEMRLPTLHVHIKKSEGDVILMGGEGNCVSLSQKKWRDSRK